MAKKEEVILTIESKINIDENRIIQCISAIRDLKEQQAQLQEQLEKGVIGQEEYNKRMAVTEVQIESHKNAVDLLNQTNTKRLSQIKLQEGAISTSKAELTKLTEEYDNLAKAERNSAKGEELRQKLKCLNSELDTAQNSFKRTEEEIKNYETQILSAIGMNDGFVGSLMNMARAGGGFKGMFSTMITSASSFGKALLSLAANPVVLTLIAIVLAVRLIVEAFKKNEQATEKLNVITDKLNAVLAVLSTVFDLLLKAMKPITDFIADTLVKVFDLAMGAIESMVSALAGVLSFLGFDSAAGKLNKFNEKVKDSVKNTLELVKAEKELKKSEEELAKTQKKLQKEIDKLKAKQDDATLSNKERIEAAEEIGRKMKESLQAELKVAEQALAVANIKLRTEGRTAEALAMQAAASEKIADINDALIQSEKDTQKTISSIRQGGADKGQEIAQKEAEVKQALEDAQIKMMEEGLEKIQKETQVSYDRQVEALKKRLKEESGLTAEAKKALTEHIALLEKEKNQTLGKINKENLEKVASEELERLNMELSLIKQTSDKALDIKKKQLEKERETRLKEAKKLGIDENLVIEKYKEEEAKIIKEHEKAIYNELLTNEKTRFEEKLNGIVVEGIAEQQLKLKLKQDELAQLSQLQHESDKDFRDRRKTLADEVKTDEEALFASRLAEMTTKGATEKEAKLLLKQEEIANLDQLEGISEEERAQRRLTLMADERALKQEVLEEEMDTASAKMKVHQKMFDDMGGVLEEFGINSAALGVFSKALALSDIGINTAKAISQGVVSAQAVPFPGNIPAVVTTIATIMANVANAKKLLAKEKTPAAPKFATGGLIAGEGSGTSDSITARVSSGESIITAMGTQMFGPMLSAFNQIGGGVPISTANSGQQAMGQEMLTDAFRKALKTMPSPVVSVREIGDVNKRVEVLESYGSL